MSGQVILEEVIPIEQSDPEFAELIRQVVEINKQFPKNKRPVLIDDAGVYFKGKKITIGRNESCPCGSEVKYKHCCGRGI
jgi:uncharacterized protein YchJ